MYASCICKISVGEGAMVSREAAVPVRKSSEGEVEGVPVGRLLGEAEGVLVGSGVGAAVAASTTL